MNIIMFDVHAANVTQSHGTGTPLLVCNIRELAVSDMQSAAHLTQILRTIRQMRLQTGRRKAATYQSIHRYIFEGTVKYRSILAPLNKIETIATQMSKRA